MSAATASTAVVVTTLDARDVLRQIEEWSTGWAYYGEARYWLRIRRGTGYRRFARAVRELEATGLVTVEIEGDEVVLRVVGS